MKNGNKSLRVPDCIIATRKADREMEFETKGPGFHARTRVVKNKKQYTRKSKHKNYDQ